MTNKKICRVLLPCLLTAGLELHAAVLYETTFSTNDNSMDLVQGQTVAYATWTLSQTIQNVMIEAPLVFQNGVGVLPGPYGASVYLTNLTGPNSSAANILATVDVLATGTVNLATPVPYQTLFAGLTLGPGTYYAIIVPTGNPFFWQGSDSFTQTLNPLVTLPFFGVARATHPGQYNAGNPLQSNFGGVNGPAFGFRLSTGIATDNPIPEPSTLGLMVIGIPLAVCYRRMRR